METNPDRCIGVNVSLPASMFDALCREADRRKTARSVVVVDALKQWLGLDTSKPSKRRAKSA